jgi:hypothetical protein
LTFMLPIFSGGVALSDEESGAGVDNRPDH